MASKLVRKAAMTTTPATTMAVTPIAPSRTTGFVNPMDQEEAVVTVTAVMALSVAMRNAMMGT